MNNELFEDSLFFKAFLMLFQNLLIEKIVQNYSYINCWVIIIQNIKKFINSIFIFFIPIITIIINLIEIIIIFNLNDTIANFFKFLIFNFIKIIIINFIYH